MKIQPNLFSNIVHCYFSLLRGYLYQTKKKHDWDPHGGYTVIIAFIFLLGFTQNFTNSFAHLFGLYFQALNIKRHVLFFLYGFGLINNYKTFNTKKLRLANYFKENPINSANPFNINNLQKTN